VSPRKRPPAKRKPRPIEAIIADAWKIRDELDEAAKQATGHAAQTGDERIRRALETVTEMLYFKQTHKWEGLLGSLLHRLDPNVYQLFEERGASAAYDAVRPPEKT
jgi:hypothetical protein